MSTTGRTSETIVVDATRATDAQTIANNLLEAQRHLINHTLNYIYTQDAAGKMDVKSAFDLIKDCGAAAVDYTTNDPVGTSTARYMDGKKRRSKRVKNMTLQCRQISPRRRR